MFRAGEPSIANISETKIIRKDEKPVRVSDLIYMRAQLPLVPQRGQRNPPPKLPPVGTMLKYRLASSPHHADARVVGVGRSMLSIELVATGAKLTCVQLHRGDPKDCPRGDCYIP